MSFPKGDGAKRRKTFPTDADDGARIASGNDVIRLNVGGTRLDVLRRTLTVVPGSMLEAQFGGRWDDSNVAKDEDGNFFIEENVEVFRLLIEFLREQTRMLTADAYVLASPNLEHLQEPMKTNFLRMVEHYGLTEVVFPYQVRDIKRKESFPYNPFCRVSSDLHFHPFSVVPGSGNHSTQISSFEITMGDVSEVHLGRCYAVNKLAGPRWFLDCGSHSIHGAQRQVLCNVEISSSTLRQGTIVRCKRIFTEKKLRWSVNNCFLKRTVKLPKDTAVGLPKPFVRVRGELRISHIELVPSSRWYAHIIVKKKHLD